MFTKNPELLLVIFLAVFAMFMFRWFLRSPRRRDFLPGGHARNEMRHRRRRRGPPRGTRGQWECPVFLCRAWNPAHARYCRMCGEKRE
ncbi:MAG: hypothetical protein ACE5F9_12760 [Phycisphaerae bacterium]